MGKDIGFYMVSRMQESGRFLGEQTDYLAIIYNKVDVQTSKLVNNDTRHGENGA